MRCARRSARSADSPWGRLAAQRRGGPEVPNKKAAAKVREEARAKTEREVDDELAALKKKIRGK